MAKSVKIVAGNETTILAPALPTQHVLKDIKDNMPLYFPNLILPDVNYRVTYTLRDSEINIGTEYQFQRAFTYFPNQLTLTVHAPSPLKDVLHKLNVMDGRLAAIEKELQWFRNHWASSSPDSQN